LLGHETLTQDLEEASLHAVNDGCLILDVLVLKTSLLGDERPELLDVDSLTMVSVSTKVEASHTNLSKVTGVVLVEVDPMMVLTTGLTTTTGMLSMLAYTTVTVRNVASRLSSLLMTGGHLLRSIISVGNSFTEKTNGAEAGPRASLESLRRSGH